jgi:hypothetical protein
MGLGQSTRPKPVGHRLHFDRGSRHTLGFGFGNPVSQSIGYFSSNDGDEVSVPMPSHSTNQLTYLCIDRVLSLL